MEPAKGIYDEAYREPKTTRSWWERFAEKHDTNESPHVWWSNNNDREKPSWTIDSCWTWTDWDLGISAVREYG